MTPQFARRLVRVYPRRWRETHATEFVALLEDTPATPYAVADVVRHGLQEQVRSRPHLARVVVALLVFVVCDALAVANGITANLLWAPTEPLRAAALAVTLAPLASLAYCYAPRFFTVVKRHG